MLSIYNSVKEEIGWLLDWVLWHINPCELLNAKSECMCIQNMICKWIGVGNMLKKSGLICLHTVKWS